MDKIDQLQKQIERYQNGLTCIHILIVRALCMAKALGPEDQAPYLATHFEFIRREIESGGWGHAPDLISTDD